MRSMLPTLAGIALAVSPYAGNAQAPFDAKRFEVTPVHAAAAHTFSLSHAAVVGAVLSAAGEPEPIAPAATQVVIPAQRLAIFKTANLATRVPVAPDSATPLPGSAAAPTKWAIPYEYTFVPESGPPRSSHLVAQVAGRLRMVSGSTFRTELLLRLEDKADATQRYKLPQPAEVMISAAVDFVDPTDLTLDETAVWRRVVLKTANPGSTVDARIYSSVDRDGLAIDVGIERPTLAVRVDRPSVQGLGLETAQVTVSVTGLPEPEGREVELDVTQRGALEKPRLELDAKGFASTRLRSTSIGPTEVRASSPQLEAAISSPVDFKPPWAFSIAALLGGTGGALLKRLTSARRARALRVIAAGVIAGVGTAVLCAAGVNVLKIELPSAGGEALVAGIALLGGLAGLRAPTLTSA